MKIIKKLSDFKDAKAIEVAANVLSVIGEMFANSENLKQKNAKSTMEMFSAFMANSPECMRKIFAILSDEDPKTYKCYGSQAIMNMMVLVNDPIIVSLFTSQSQTGDATSSGSASENTEE